MWQFRNKKGNAPKNWHLKAMIVDPKKTKITIINSDELFDLIDNVGTVGGISATPVSFVSM